MVELTFCFATSINWNSDKRAKEFLRLLLAEGAVRSSASTGAAPTGSATVHIDLSQIAARPRGCRPWWPPARFVPGRLQRKFLTLVLLPACLDTRMLYVPTQITPPN